MNHSSDDTDTRAAVDGILSAPAPAGRSHSADKFAALRPLTDRIKTTVAGMLPPGMHFAVLLMTDLPVDGGAPCERQMLAISTDRDVVAPAAARWALGVMQHNMDERDARAQGERRAPKRPRSTGGKIL